MTSAELPARDDELFAALVAALPALLDELAGLVSNDWPSYGDVLGGARPEVTLGAAMAIRRLLALADDPGAWIGQRPSPTSTVEASAFAEIGRLEWQAGRDLTPLLTMYQNGGRIVWRHVSAAALAVGVPPRRL